MAYDEGLADRIRQHLSHHGGIEEKKMFGGISFLLNGKMCVGVVKDELCARVGPEAFDEAVKLPHARVMDFTKRPMKGWIFVAAEGVEEDTDLKAWIERCERFVKTLPPGK